ncbi:monovalent cation/H(+) antiporter subunit G [Breznakiella homolactica]|uniref:Monovalent cation/H(+) antiporter subunit G n=1 Tax=Breznakiella homolactica TaxID=2798577 RepID=A0A7T7XR70_9SPIR|nr:monovalent cation/H(+) antiporter subunit G [Breznakiella homolactica]QQO10994.1 monovalent cation/H(+) antiporter subunit G [Breznakiella homolactica]
MEFLLLLRTVGAIIFCVLACIFAVAGTIGLFRFPDTYTRLHAAALGATAAVFSVFLAALIISPDLATAGRILLIIIFFFISSPTTTHIIARYAWHSGLDPWSPPKQKMFGRFTGKKPRPVSGNGGETGEDEEA